MAFDYKAKIDRVKEMLWKTRGVAVAYSGGVDSSLVLAMAREVLGDRALAVIALSPIHSKEETDAAFQWLKAEGIDYVTVFPEELKNPDFYHNPPDRCFYCKRELFAAIWEQARIHDMHAVVDGTNADDLRHDHRPGLKAAREWSVLSPLLEAGLSKKEIRLIARDVYKLPMWDKPSMACLASRIPYGSPVTKEKLNQVAAVEAFLADQGYRVYRARHHGQVVRLELGEREMHMILDPELKKECIRVAKEQGFIYVSLDLEGYRTGSMNENL